MYDIDRLGADYLKEAVKKFGEKYYPISGEDDVKGNMKGEPYLYFSDGYEAVGDFVVLCYNEWTRHDMPYSINLELHFDDIDDKYKLEAPPIPKDTYTFEEMMEIAKYCYDYHASSSFPDKSFEDNCKNNLLQKLISDGKRI